MYAAVKLYICSLAGSAQDYYYLIKFLKMRMIFL